MPGISADNIIGKTLFAKKQIDKLNSLLQKIGQFNTGDSVGVVYSYIVRNGQVYWTFYDSFGKYYLVKHDPNGFKFSDDVQQAYEEQKQEKEKQLMETKGAIPYYIEKYGKWVLGAFIGVAIIREIIKRKK